MKTVYLREQAAAYDRYRRALEAAGARVVSGGDWRGCDGLLLPGGGDIAPARYGASPKGSEPPDLERDQQEWELLEYFLRAGRPVLGVCRGMQLLNVYLGGSLCQHIPCHAQVGDRDTLHLAENLPGPLRALYGPVMCVNSAHHQCVERLGEGLEIFQMSPDGIVEAVGNPKCSVLGVQWHPERLYPLGQKLFRDFVDDKIW